ncbi:MAG: tetraacyldisaccharide 4'-kinase [Methylococcaceae bacterium]|nr:tetraacyldisaccharide 4'-kinase [Methylococcaceae bacterium]
MKKTLAQWALDVWYKDSKIALLLVPLSIVFSGMVRVRKFLYQRGLFKSHRLSVPVIVVGNISVGGTGKTPLVIWLARLLKDAGYRPGIISRGYGGEAKSWPQWVDANSDVSQVGDEALLIAGATHCPMAVAPSRVAAANLLISQSDCNVLISDDGLQHYALNRTIEIAVIDGERRFGNGYCLPAGPLREPMSRLQAVDFVVVNGEKKLSHEFSMRLAGDTLINLLTGEQKPLQEFQQIGCHALAGIGNPERFFKVLATAGLPCTLHRFPDHYRYQRHDIDFGDDKPVLMTEKDAVKCRQLASQQHWYLPVQAQLAPDFAKQLLTTLREKT